jgi:hypothetical protein
MSSLSRKQIEDLLDTLNLHLIEKDVKGEVFLVGGAVMCLVYKARESTRDLDALFAPVDEIRIAVEKIAKSHKLPTDWLNDAAKGFLSENGEFEAFLELENLRVYKPMPEYMLAMKCLAMRIGAEFQDLNDVRYLLRYLNITTYNKAIETITKYYPTKRFPQKTLYVLEEILDG